MKRLRQKTKLNFWKNKLDKNTINQIKKSISTLKYVAFPWWKIVVVNKLWRGANKKRIQNPKQHKRKIERGCILKIFVIVKWRNVLIIINKSKTTIKDTTIICVSKVANSLKLCGLKKATTGIKKTIKPEKNSINKVRKKFILNFNGNLIIYNQKLMEKINYFFIYFDFKFLKILVTKAFVLYQ